MSENKNDKGYASLTGFRRSVPIILLAIAAFIALCFITKETSATGELGNVISGVLLGLFAKGAYAIPVLLMLHAVFYASDVAGGRTVSRVIFSFTALISLSAIIYTVGNFGDELAFDAGAFYTDGTQGVGGGFIGNTVAFAIIKIFGHVGLIIVAAVIIALYVSFFFAKGRGAAKRSFYGALLAFAKLGARVEKRVGGIFGKLKSRKNKKAERLSQERTDELFDDEYFAVDNGMKELSIPTLGIHESRSEKSLEENPTLQNKVKHKSAEETYVKSDFAQKRESTAATGGVSFADGYGFGKNEDVGATFAADTAADEEKSRVSERISYGLDCSADEIFTKDFSPIDFALDSSEANRPSSKTAPSVPSTANEIKEKLHSISEQDIEMARRKADFDMKKKAAFDAMRAQNAQNAPDTPYAKESYNRAAEFISGVNREYSEAVQMPKHHQSDERVGYPYNSAYTATTQQATYTAPTQQQATYTEAEPTQVANEPTAYTEKEQPRAWVDDAVRSSESKPTGAPVYFEVPKTPASDINSRHVERADEASQNEQSAQAAPYDIIAEDVPTAQTYSEPINDSFVHSESEPLNEHFSENESEAPEITESTARLDEVYTEAEGEIPEQRDDEVITLARSMLSPTPEADNSIYIDVNYAEEKEDNPFGSYISDSDTVIEIPSLEDAESENSKAAPEQIEKPESAPTRLYTYSDDLGKDDKVVVAEKTQPTEEDGPKNKRPDYSAYKFPSLEILGKSDSTYNESLTEEMEENGNKIIETLASFNVLASIKGYDRGPRITRYEVVPAKGVRVNQVVNLFDDIALSLAAEGIRIEAPIPGKSAIGFELPNKTPETVRLRDLLETDEFKNAPSKTLACIGKDVTGSPVFGDIAKMPHVLIAGATGMGKSVCINSILISILYKARPDEVKLILIDPKKVEFKMYNGIPHLLVPVVSDAKQAAGALMWAVEEMERRYDAIEEQNVRNIEGYNEKVRANPKLGEPMPKLIIVIDELNDLMLQVRDPVEGLIMSIAQKARAAGIHLIIGTQRPSVNVITGVIKANIPSRMSCKVASYTDSKTILERAGAERLLDKGDMLYHPVGTPKPLRVQSAFVSDPEVYAVMDALKENKDMISYDDKVMEDITRAAQKCVKSKSGSSDDRDMDGDSSQDAANYMHDKQFLDAVDIAVTSGKISTSLIQRRIGVGYGKAAKFIDIMESIGIVSEPNGQKPRETLISKDDWLERLANYG